MGGNPHIASLSGQRLYEVEAEPDQVARDMGLDPGEIIDFSLNVNPLGPPDAALEAARQSLDRCNAYPDLRLRELRRAVAKWHGVSPDWLLFGSGLDEVIKLLVSAWTAEGDRVLIHIPTFPRFALEVQARGAEPLFVRSDPPWTVSPDAIAEALDRDRPALAFLCSPNNPTGTALAPDTIAEFVDANPDTTFIVDEALIYPLESGAVPLVEGRPNLAVLRTFSKYWALAGFRVGYAIAHESLLRTVEAIRPPFNVTLPSAAAACAALEDVEGLKRSHSFFAEERDFFERAISDLERISILGGNANMVLIGLDGVDGPDLCGKLARQGILVADGQSFHGLEKQDTIRISLRDRAANELLSAVLHAVISDNPEHSP